MVRWCSAFAVLLCVLSGCRAPSVPPDGGTPRIVSLAPSITEVLFEIGAGPNVVGVTTYCTYPAETASLPRVGGYMTPSLEAIAVLRPDLVVVLPEHADVTPQIQALGLETLTVDHRSFAGVIDSMERLGALAGSRQTADAVGRLSDLLAAASVNAPAAGGKPRVLLVVARGDDAARVHAAGPGTIHHELIEYAGGRNALENTAARYPTLSIEGIARLDPDVIVEFAAGPGEAGLASSWTAHQVLRAVRTGRVHVFTDDFLSVPGPRFVRFTSRLVRVLNGSSR